MTETLKVHRLTDRGYLVVLIAKRNEVIRAEPFEDLEFTLADLLDGGEVE